MKYPKLTFGQMEAIVNKLGGMEGAKKLLRGDIELVDRTHVINCDASPYVKEGLSIMEHHRRGQVQWQASQFSEFLLEKQQEEAINGYEVLWRLVNKGRKTPHNACVLDYLIEHQELIPDEWKDNQSIAFWGTIFSSEGEADRYVACLAWQNKRWSYSLRSLKEEFGKGDYAIIEK